MKQSIHFLTLFFFIFLLTTSQALASFSSSSLGEDLLELNEITTKDSIQELNFDTLMGSEDCENVDEECIKRRIMAEAHLDYIYTQHHKP